MGRTSYSRNYSKNYYPSIKETGEKHKRQCLRCDKGFVARSKFFRLCEFCRKAVAINDVTRFATCLLILFLTGCSSTSVMDYLSLEKRVTRIERSLPSVGKYARQTQLIANTLDEYFNGDEIKLTRTKDGKCLELKLKYGDELDWKEVECQKKKK